ncbi:MAG: hypothetical protein ACRELT_11970, partial [Longimicrobiales bacterium]
MSEHRTETERIPIALVVAGGAFVVVVVLLVAMSISRPEPPGFAPTAVQERTAGNSLVGPELVTV